DALHISIDEIDLSGVEANSHVDADRVERLVDRFGTSDRAGRTVEGREESVTRRLHLSPLEPIERLADDPVVLGEELAPSRISDLGRAVGRADDVREENRREHTVVLRSGARTGDEVLDLPQH